MPEFDNGEIISQPDVEMHVSRGLVRARIHGCKGIGR
jgi:hypothetical protein